MTESFSLIEKCVLVPASDVVTFLRSERASGAAIIYVGCLYKWAEGGTRPSMELSATTEEMKDWHAFEAFVADAAVKAQVVADSEGAAAFFEVGLDQRIVGA